MMLKKKNNLNYDDTYKKVKENEDISIKKETIMA
jgi:hypothetical protein